MNLRSFLRAAIAAALLFGPQAIASISSGPARDAGGAVDGGAAPEEPDPEFKRRFQAAMKVNSKNETAKLVKDNVSDAAAWIVRTGEQIAGGSNEELDAFMTWLREAWQTSVKSEFAERTYTYFSTLETAKRKNREELKKQFASLLGDYRRNLEAKDGWTFKKLADEFDVVASGFEQEGDFYFSSEAWNVFATCFDSPLRGSDADLYRASKGYEAALAMRDRVDLEDKLYEDMAKRRDALAKKGADQEPPPVAPPAEKDEPEPVVPGQEVTVPLTFEVVPEVTAFQRPHYMADENYLLWNALFFTVKGTTSTFTRINAPPVATRVGSNEVKLDVDGDGKPETKIPLTGNTELVRLKLGQGPNERPWAFLAATGAEQDRYQNIEVNKQPTDNEMEVFTFSAASVVGALNAIPIRICDDDMDALYGNVPRAWGHQGMSKDNFQPEMDSIVIGNAKRARPWSEMQEIGGVWYKLAVSADGKELKAQPVHLDTALVKLKFTGPQPTWLVLRGTGELQNSFFDIAEGGAKGVMLPVGKYGLYYGDVRKGKKLETMKAVIVAGKTSPTWEVTKGTTTTVGLGGPFGFDFRKQVDDEKVTIEGQSVVIVGAHGERYERAWNCVPHPEVSWRKKGSKKASKPVRMDFMLDVDGITKYSWRAAWSPYDYIFEVQGGAQGVEVQLTEKKNELFGKIESEWKE